MLDKGKINMLFRTRSKRLFKNSHLLVTLTLGHCLAALPGRHGQGGQADAPESTPQGAACLAAGCLWADGGKQRFNNLPEGESATEV